MLKRTKERKTTERVQRARAPLRRASACRRTGARLRQSGARQILRSLWFSKRTTCLDIHHSVCLKHCNFLNRPKYTVSPTAVYMEHQGKSKRTGIQTIGTSNSDPNTVRSPNVSDQKSWEFQPLCCPYPRTPPRPTESWRVGEGDFTFDASKTRIVLLPMECVPKTSLCIVPALNRGFLR